MYCTDLTSNEIFSLVIVGILTADVYAENLLYDVGTSAVEMSNIANEKISFEVKFVQKYLQYN
jgi:hypothetical protein